jgi:tryptophanyl-tRNA synthetase
MSLAAHYETVRDRHDCETPDGIDWLAPLARRFVAVDGYTSVAAAPERETLVCMGVGMTGPPHLGTLGQILTAIEVQAAGLPVQFVLADLEPYHGGADWDRVRELAERYREFAVGLGFDPDRGALRTQSEATDVMATAHRLARYYRPEEWDDGDGPATEWERAVGDAYERPEGANPGPTSEAAAAHSGVLHGADFLHPLTDGYEQVVIALGVDEHGLTPWTRRFRDATPVAGTVAGLHTRMVPGFDGPKMSKSIDAGLSLDADPERLRRRIATADDASEPAESASFAAMALASRYDAGKLDRLETARRTGGEAWATVKREYADEVADLATKWRATED